MRGLGLIVNPVAGMGGSVGLKGTDGELYKRALELGAEPVAPVRTEEFLTHHERVDHITLLVGPGEMGARHMRDQGIRFSAVGQIGDGTSAEDSKKEVAAVVVEQMDNETLYLLGLGTTLRPITDRMGISKTLLGVDAVRACGLLAEDLNERGILALLERHEKRCIIVTPLGGNGFIFGRGDKQFTPEVIRCIGPGNIRIIAAGRKLRGLDCLRVDTGDQEVDQMLCGWVKVTVGYQEGRMIEARC